VLANGLSDVEASAIQFELSENKQRLNEYAYERACGTSPLFYGLDFAETLVSRKEIWQKLISSD
jgi:hypothetical protein